MSNHHSHNAHQHHAAQHHRTADFSERALAFAADYAVFAVGWAITLKMIAPGVPLLHNERGSLVVLIWTALFVLYQAFLGCEGRATIGKHLLGLRVVGADEEPLDLSHGIIRALGYLPSSFMSLGFFWALLDERQRAWHDLAAGSRVVALKPFGATRRSSMRFATGVLVASFAVLWGWRNIWEPRYLKIMSVAYAKAGLEEVGELQRAYKLQNGRYADNLLSLAAVSVDPTGFLRDSAALYDLNTFRFKADEKSYIVVARAKDVDHTLVAVNGP